MFCKHCGAEVNDNATVCVKCGCAVGNVSVQKLGDNAAVRMLIPVGRSGLAIAAGYLGLLAPGLAPVALIVGILALRDLRKHPDKHGKGRAWFGIIMGAIFSLLYFAVFSFLPFVGREN